ncbi:MAG: hydroxymethylglutaryl-CoA lyase [Chloroflexia bacterium]|nr:hydroxymethylglutaryl-CoA lyase [Chloroflexia bacterium]
MLANLPKSVTIVDMTPRDGFQMESGYVIPTEQKIEIVNMLSRTGVPEIQVTAFVRPEAVPQLKDAAEVMKGIERIPGVKYRALVPNLKGAERAIDAGADELNMLLSVTDSHSLSNANRTTEDALDTLAPVVKLAREKDVPVTGGTACSLGCPFEGFPPVERLVWVIERFHGWGVRKISVADTVGMANPVLVYDRLSRLRERFPDVEFSLHLHDTRRMAMPNIIAGLQAGVTEFDGTVGGLGGCPYAPGATGNISTEDMVHMFHEMGIETGVDLDGLLDVARRLREIVNHDLDSNILRAGKSSDLIQEKVTGQRRLA